MQNDNHGSIRTGLDGPTHPQRTLRRISRRSRLAPLPLGAAFARSFHPTGASEGGADGECFPLVGQSAPRHRSTFAAAVRTGVRRPTAFVRAELPVAGSSVRTRCASRVHRPSIDPIEQDWTKLDQYKLLWRVTKRASDNNHSSGGHHEKMPCAIATPSICRR